ncbi:MAG: long-chain fatty acid--CoA ligase [Spirochaetaceae bacterium]|nr:long-chain fatty acid--CoA ligase [Spirochaetaceae bacterium]
MVNTIPQMFLEQAQKHADLPAQYSKIGSGEFKSLNYARLKEDIAAFAAGLLEIGVARGDHVGLISDNRREWLVSDLAILGLGAADVPRGCDATEQEVRYILDWSECRLAILENDKQLKKILSVKSGMPALRQVLLFDAAEDATKEEARAAGLEVTDYNAVFALGAARRAKNAGEYEAEAAKGTREDLATLIYTSGTTGEPKGVMLSHGNFLHQTDFVPTIVHIKPGHVFLSVLPVWHSFERIVQYIILAAGAGIAYSKPIGSIMLADMQAVKPHWFTSVPRIWESVKDGVYRNIKAHGGIKKVLFSFFVGVGESYSYFRNHVLGYVPAFAPRSRILEIALCILPMLLLAPLRALGAILVFKKIREKLGGRFIAGISGGGALPPSVDRFFNAIGVLILEGYGLTETAPVIGVRPQDKPTLGTVGPALRGTDIKIVDELGEKVHAGSKGLILVRGPTIMLGYYKKPDLTAKVMRAEGWLDTGDLGMLTRYGELRITGRAKDTIVLLGGENIEPVPIEQRLCESEYVKQAVVLGQDQKYLAALIVPDQDAVTAWAKENVSAIIDYESLIQQPEVLELFDSEIAERVSAKNGFKSFERIFRFALLPVPFEVGKELSAKQEIKRHAVVEIYHKQVKKLFEA